MPEPANKNEVLPFLREYAKLLRAGADISKDFPLHRRVSMPRGVAWIETVDGRHVATIKVEGDSVCPSMPVGPASMTYARLFVELANKFHAENTE